MESSSASASASASANASESASASDSDSQDTYALKQLAWQGCHLNPALPQEDSLTPLKPPGFLSTCSTGASDACLSKTSKNK